MSISYAYEKLYVAMLILATNRGDLPSRLEDAYASSLIRLRPYDLPEGELRKAMQAITEDLVWAEAKGDEGTLAATVKLLDELEAKDIATRIFNLFLKVYELDDLH